VYGLDDVNYCKFFCCCIAVPPHIDSSDLDLNPKVIRGKSVTLNCPVQGTPFPNITWLKNDRVLSENEAGRRLRVRLSGRQLELSLAQQSDAAKYTCVAVNIAGKAAQHFHLQVLGDDQCFQFSITES